MNIKYINVRRTGAPKMSRYDATTITAVVHRTPGFNTLGLSAKDQLSIYFEQATLADYLLGANPNNKLLQAYRDACTLGIKTLCPNGQLEAGVLEKEQLSAPDVKLVYDYVTKGLNIGGKLLDKIANEFSGDSDSKYTFVPKEFLIPYLGHRGGFISAEGEREANTFNNPVVLSAIVKPDADGENLSIDMYCRQYVSMSVDKKIPAAGTLGYICSMNHNGRSWRELIDTIQSTSVSAGTRTGTEALSNVLNSYFHGASLSDYTDTKQLKRDLRFALETVMTRDTLVVERNPTEIKELRSLFAYLGDERLNYLLNLDPQVKQTKLWQNEHDLQFLTPLSLAGYVMAADDSASSGDDSASEQTDNTDDTTGDDPDADTGDEGTSEEDPFSDGDDFADVEEPASDDSSEENGSSASTDTPSDSGDSNVKAEDVNPIIELITDESFDEYLDRSVLQTRIQRLIANPPASLATKDLRFLTYWYLQWFPCVSVATTKEILKDILKVKPKPLR